MKKLLISGLVGKLGVLVPKDTFAASEFFADLGRNTEIFGLGVAFLGLQITNLENRCVAMHGPARSKALFHEMKAKKANFVQHLQRQLPRRLRAKKQAELFIENLPLGNR